MSCFCPALFLPPTSARCLPAVGLWETPPETVVKPNTTSCCQMPLRLNSPPRTRDGEQSSSSRRSAGLYGGEETTAGWEGAWKSPLAGFGDSR